MDGHIASGRGGADGAAGAASASDEWTIRRLLAWTTPYLRERSVDSPRTVVEILLAEVLGVERLRLYMEPDRVLSAEELARLRGLVARAGRHEPVQFLVGRWPFFGRDFEVAPCTLIPRPATETLVERALDWYRARGGGDADVLDLCTGSGCVAISFFLGARAIARPEGVGCRPLEAVRAGADDTWRDPRDSHGFEDHGAGAERAIAFDGEGHRIESAGMPSPNHQEGRPPMESGARSGAERDGGSESEERPLRRSSASLRVVGTDVVAEAVELARRNATRLGAAGIDFGVGDLWNAIQGDESRQFDAVLSNPPYVTDDEYAKLDANVRDFEPATALRGGRDGLDFVRRIVSGAAERIRPGGLLAIEVGWKHGAAVRELLAAGPWADLRVDRDHEGIDRVVSAIRLPT